MAFAGEVFPEWYWGPIFFLIVFGLPLSAAALAVDFVVRRWVRRLPWTQRGALWVGVVAGGSLLILGGRAVKDHVRFERDAQATARSFDFTPYEAKPLPSGFRAETVRAQAIGDPVLVAQYEVEPAGWAIAYQQRAGAVSLADGHCVLSRIAGSGTNFFDGPCRALTSPGGRSVHFGASRTISGGADAFAVLDGTLVRLEQSGVSERAALAWFDALGPVAPGEIDFKGP